MFSILLALAWLRYPQGVIAAVADERDVPDDPLCQIHSSCFLNLLLPTVTFNKCFDEHNAVDDVIKNIPQTARFPAECSRLRALGDVVSFGDLINNAIPPSVSEQGATIGDYRHHDNESGPQHRAPTSLSHLHKIDEMTINVLENDQSSLMERWRSSERSTGRRSRHEDSGRNRTRSVRTTAEETRRLVPLPRRRTASEPAVLPSEAESSAALAHELVEDLALWRWMLDLEVEEDEANRSSAASSSTTCRHPDFVMLPTFIRERISDNLEDKDMPTLCRMAVAANLVLNLVSMEVTQAMCEAFRKCQDRENNNGVSRDRDRDRDDEDNTAMMQTHLHGGDQHGQERRRGSRPPWRPRKTARVSYRRRRLDRRRRSLRQDVAEWSALAGPQFHGAAHATSRIAGELRCALNAQQRPPDAPGLCRQESDRLQQVLRENGDQGAIIALAGLFHMLGRWALDVSDVLNVHVLHRVAERRGHGDRRRRSSRPDAGSSGSITRRTPTPMTGHGGGAIAGAEQHRSW